MGNNAPSTAPAEAPATRATPEQIEAAKKNQALRAKSSLDALKGTIKQPELLGTETKESLLNEAILKIPKFTLSFTKDGQQAFLDGIREKAKSGLSGEKDEVKKEKMADIYTDSVFGKFIDTFVPTYYFLLADEAPGDIAFSINVNENGNVDITPKDPANDNARVTAAKKAADDRAQEGVKDLPQSGEMNRFQKDHPEAFDFLKGIVFGNDQAQLEAAFAGGGLLGFLLGVIGYGGGKSMYGAFMKNKNFEQYANKGMDYLAKLHPSLDFRKPIDLEKDSDLHEYYAQLPKNEFRTIDRKFVVKKDIVLPAVTTFRSIVFPKGKDEKIELSSASKNGGSPFGVLSLKREEGQDNITVNVGTKIEAGTVFSDISIGDKTAIEAAQNGAPQTPEAATPKPTGTDSAPDVK